MVDRRSRKIARFVLLLAPLFGLALAAETDAPPVAAVVLTHTGVRIEGTLTGLAPIIRMDPSPLIPRLLPDQIVDIPLTAVRQLTFDFPRVVVETDDDVYVGPFSIFSGIAESLVLERDSETLRLPVTSLRAIALHGTPFHQPPREWLGDGFLSMPRVTATTTPVAPSTASIEEEETAMEVEEAMLSEPFLASAENTEDVLLFSTSEEVYPTPPASLAPREASPWMSILIVAALIVATYLLI